MQVFFFIFLWTQGSWPLCPSAMTFFFLVRIDDLCLCFFEPLPPLCVFLFLSQKGQHSTIAHACSTLCGVCTTRFLPPWEREEGFLGDVRMVELRREEDCLNRSFSFFTLFTLLGHTTATNRECPGYCSLSCFCHTFFEAQIVGPHFMHAWVPLFPCSTRLAIYDRGYSREWLPFTSRFVFFFFFIFYARPLLASISLYHLPLESSPNLTPLHRSG